MRVAGDRPGEPVRVLGRGAHLAAAVRVPAAGAGVGAHPRRQQQEAGQQAAPPHDLRLALPAGQELRRPRHQVHPSTRIYVPSEY